MLLDFHIKIHVWENIIFWKWIKNICDFLGNLWTLQDIAQIDFAVPMLSKAIPPCYQAMFFCFMVYDMVISEVLMSMNPLLNFACEVSSEYSSKKKTKTKTKHITMITEVNL